MSQRAALFASMLLTVLCMALVGTVHLVTSIVTEVQAESSAPDAAAQSAESGSTQPVAAVTVIPTVKPLPTRPRTRTRLSQPNNRKP